jgi:hypothetical protein
LKSIAVALCHVHEEQIAGAPIRLVSNGGSDAEPASQCQAELEGPVLAGMLAAARTAALS